MKNRQLKRTGGFLFEIKDRKTEEAGSHQNKVQNTYLITFHMEYKHISFSLFRKNHDVR